MVRYIVKGRGAQSNPRNRFSRLSVIPEEEIDTSWFDFQLNPKRQVFEEQAQTILSSFDSPDVPHGLSINPYQGCEHGCVYCYARNSHEYWGFSAGLDFETKLIVKRNAAELLERKLISRAWTPKPVMLSGNTDCYQPIESRLKLTRSILKVFLKYRNPVSIITKNSLILRDLDLLKEMASMNLVHVMITINSLNEDLRKKMEPRTTTYQKRLNAIESLSQCNIPTGVMIAPIIPGLNLHEIPNIVKYSADAGALTIDSAVLRLNGNLKEIFTEWIKAVYPNRAKKVLAQVSSLHGGQVNDSRFFKRMIGEGKIAEMARQLVTSATKRHMSGRAWPSLEIHHFRTGGMYTIW